MFKRCHSKQVLICLLIALSIIVVFQYSFLQTHERFCQLHKDESRNASFRNERKYVRFNATASSQSQCEVIHLAIVCVGSKSSQQVVTLIKSLLFHRKNPVHIHFLVDKDTKPILSYMFQTWDIPDLTVSFYLVEKYLHEILWIPNNHYSGVYGLVKVIILIILSNSIDKVITLDTDLVLTADIALLWSEFHLFKHEEAIGLVENQSDWYLGTLWLNYYPWPADGRGFNTGVMLLDCVKLRSWGWEKKWQKNIKLTLEKFGKTSLADQDIINSVLKENRNLVYVLPCKWNVQLSKHVRTDLCLDDHFHDIGILHWNNKVKLTIASRLTYLQSFNDLYADLNGDLLKIPMFHCRASVETDAHWLDHHNADICKLITESNSLLRRTHLFYFPFHYGSAGQGDVSLIVQLSMERFPMFEKLCSLWSGPVSVAVFIKDSESIELNQYITASTVLENRVNVAYHLVYKKAKEHVYPINYLRNVALKNAVTEYVFLNDVDFAPMPFLYQYILSHISSSVVSDKSALVIPAFESTDYALKVPPTKSTLLEDMEKGTIVTFRSLLWPQGHLSTNFTIWKSATSPYDIKWDPLFEPYVVVKRQNCPLYDKRFSGFGWNKVSHITELHAAGYNFTVLPFGFIIHFPHAPSKELLQYRNSADYRSCLQELKSNFIEELRMKYKNLSVA